MRYSGYEWFWQPQRDGKRGRIMVDDALRGQERINISIRPEKVIDVLTEIEARLPTWITLGALLIYYRDRGGFWHRIIFNDVNRHFSICRTWVRQRELSKHWQNTLRNDDIEEQTA